MKYDNLKACLVALLLVTSSIASSADKYTFDKVHTQILFFANHLGFSKSQGEFHDFDGSFVFDPQDMRNSHVEVAINTASIDMDYKKWDDHMKNEDFFNVRKFPTMTFRSTKVIPTGEKSARIIGELTLLGITKPVEVEMTFNKAGIHPFSKKYVAGFSAHTTIIRSDFGMTYGLPALGDEVEIRLEVEGERED